MVSATRWNLYSFFFFGLLDLPKKKCFLAEMSLDFEAGKVANHVVSFVCRY